MIIFAKADGQVIQTQPTPIYQGSSLKGSVYLVAPFPSSNGVTIQFQLPNGNVTKAYPMTPTGEIEGVKFENTEMSAWVWDVANSMVTANPGVVGVTMLVYEASPNITYYGSFPSSSAIENIENPQTNAYAYCVDDRKVYKYNGSDWVEGDITINAQDYQVTAITTSFPVIKGVPNAIPPSPPSEDEWNTIISLLNNLGLKVTQPLMTNFTYDVNTGESVKTYNNGAVETVNFPSYIDNSITEYEGFAKIEFTARVDSNNWVDNSGSYSLTLPLPVTLPNGLDYDVVVYKKQPNDKAEKMYPTIDISTTSITIISENPYMGYALITKRGTYVGEEILSDIDTAIENVDAAAYDASHAADLANAATNRANTAAADARTAEASANTAANRADSIAQTLETAYANGEFKGEPGAEGESLYSVYENEILSENPVQGATFNINSSVVAILSVDKPVNKGDSIVDGLGNIYLVENVGNSGNPIQVSWTGTNIRGPHGVEIESVRVVENYKTESAVFYFLRTTLSDGRVLSSEFSIPRGEQGAQGPQGVSVFNAQVDSNGDLIITLDDGRSWNAGRVVGPSGGGGGGGKTLLYMAGANGMYNYEVSFKLPMQGVSKVTINYTVQYDSYFYQQEYGNANVVIYDSSQSVPNLRPTLRLLTDDYSNSTFVDVPVSWRGDGETFNLNFYDATNNAFGIPYGAAAISILFILE